MDLDIETTICLQYNAQNTRAWIEEEEELFYLENKINFNN